MRDWDDGMGSTGWGWIPMTIMMGVFLLLAVWVVVTLVRRDGAGSGHVHLPARDDSARRILDERFARGELDEEEYSSRRAALEGAYRST